MLAISASIAAEMPHETARCGHGKNWSSQATVHPKIVIDIANFMGLIHGLIPMTVRWSKGAMAIIAMSSATLSQPVTAKGGLLSYSLRNIPLNIKQHILRTQGQRFVMIRPHG